MVKQLVILIFLLLTIAGCDKYVTKEGMTGINNRFENAKIQLEQKAQNGQISWVQAESRIRDLDKEVKDKLDATGASHTWRYDSGDEEYYAYCIALAEKLDKREISYAQFDAVRKRAFNQIEARRQSLQNQQEIIENTRPRQQNCVTEKVLDTYETKCY